MPTRPGEEGPRLHVGGNLTGQAIVGSHITAVWRQEPQSIVVTAADREELRDALDRLRALVAAEDAPDGDVAETKLQELERAVTDDERPDLATMEHVEGWFSRRFPAVAGAVGRLIVSPLVAKFVGAAGEDLVAEFHRRFGP